MNDYKTFLKSKSQFGDNLGFRPIWIPDFLFDFQSDVIDAMYTL